MSGRSGGKLGMPLFPFNPRLASLDLGVSECGQQYEAIPIVYRLFSD